MPYDREKEKGREIIERESRATDAICSRCAQAADDLLSTHIHHRRSIMSDNYKQLIPLLMIVIEFLCSST